LQCGITFSPQRRIDYMVFSCGRVVAQNHPGEMTLGQQKPVGDLQNS
jgi:hypothetical protein